MVEGSLPLAGAMTRGDPAGSMGSCRSWTRRPLRSAKLLPKSRAEPCSERLAGGNGWAQQKGSKQANFYVWS